MVLTNQELYLYSDRDSQNYNTLIILTPGVFVKGLSGISLDSSGQDLKKVYPIELHISGHLTNIGSG
jgi:hypothetical protein